MGGLEGKRVEEGKAGDDEEKTKIAQKFCDEAFSINESKPSHVNLVYAVIGTNDEDDDV